MLSMGYYEENLRKDSNSNFTKNITKHVIGWCWWGERGDLKEVRLMVILLGGGIYPRLALFFIQIFDLYMILCSRQVIYLNKFSIVKLSFDGRAPIRHNWDLSICWINYLFRRVDIYAFLVGQKDILYPKLCNEDVNLIQSRLVRRTPCKE